MDGEPSTTKTQQQASMDSRKAKRRKRFSVKAGRYFLGKKTAATYDPTVSLPVRARFAVLFHAVNTIN
jgi:hypothetical protein